MTDCSGFVSEEDAPWQRAFLIPKLCALAYGAQVVDLVVVRFEDGSECRVRADDDPQRLKPMQQSSLLADAVC